MYQLKVVPNSQNNKLGCGVATTYRPVGEAGSGNGTCPDTCQLLAEGKCYTFKGKTAIWQRKSKECFDDVNRLSEKQAEYVRVHTSGDFFKYSVTHTHTHKRSYCVDTQYVSDLMRWCSDNPKKKVWTYCHDIMAFVEDTGLSYKENNIPKNFWIVASCDTQEQKEFALFHGFKTARVIKTMGEVTHDELFCPYDKALHHGLKGSTISVRCTNCQLCFKDGKNIAFLKQ